MTDKTDRNIDAVASNASEIAQKGERNFIRALAADPKVRGELSERERKDAAEGRVSPETAHKIAAAAARDQARKR